jgi:hypothetical protein
MKNNVKKIMFGLGVALSMTTTSLIAQPADCNVCYKRMIDCENGVYDPSSYYCRVWLDACFAACVPGR